MSNCSESTSIERVQGSLTLETVAELCGRLRERLALNTGLTIDLSGVSQCDSAGLQLLWSLLRTAHDRGHPLSLTNPSQSIRQTALSAGANPQEFAATARPESAL